MGQVRLALLPKPAPSLSTLLNISEIDHLEYFHLVAIRSFSSHFGDSLWSKTVLQISHSEASIRTAVSALSSVLKRLSSSLQTTDKSESTGDYVQAIRALNHRLDGSKLSWKLALISSLLFTAFEALVGTDKAALQHLRAGFAMLREYSSKFQQPSEDFRDLANAFSSFDIQASTFALLYSPMHSSLTSIPPCFVSIREARESLDSIVAYIHTVWKSYGCRKYRTLPYTTLPSSLSKQVNDIKALLDQWSTTYTTFLALSTCRLSPAAVQILKIQHITAKIQIETYFYRDQLVYDAFTSGFTQIITLASAVAEKLLIDSDGMAPSFSFEVRIIPSLYFTACRCRNTMLRRRAIGLLEKSGAEGLWDGKTMAAAARWALKLEEEGGDGVDDFIPEERRLREIGVAVDRIAKRVRVASSRRVADGSTDYVSDNVGWGENTGVVVEDEAGLLLWTEEWRNYTEASSPSS